MTQPGILRHAYFVSHEKAHHKSIIFSLDEPPKGEHRASRSGRIPGCPGGSKRPENSNRLRSGDPLLRAFPQEVSSRTIVSRSSAPLTIAPSPKLNNFGWFSGKSRFGKQGVVVIDV